MKHLFKILLTLCIISVCNSAYSQDTVSNTITNFNITDGGTKFSYDVYILRTTPSSFRMGSSSFYVRYTGATMNNPVLSNINPKYTVGSVSNSYTNPFTIINGSTSKVGIQLLYTSGLGDDITDNPGFDGLGERVATVTMDILAAVAITFNWDQINSDVVNPGGTLTAKSLYFGTYTGTLPVELSSFVSVINKNNVTLNWSTSKEINNSGFEIERKNSDENSNWSKIAFVNGNGNTNDNKIYSYKDVGLNTGKYNFRLKQIDFNGNFEYFNLQNEVTVGVPSQFELNQNYPNPFNPVTKINFSIPSDSKVKLDVYDISGKLVATLINNEIKTANYYSIEFNGANYSSGTYFYTLQSGGIVVTKKMVLLK